MQAAIRAPLRHVALHAWRGLLSRSGAARNSSAAASAAKSKKKSADADAAAGSSGVYDDPEVYDVAFSYRDFPKETAFLRAAYERHCGGAPLRSVLELACGPARHAALLAAAGADAVGLDASPAMLAYAAKHAGSQAPAGKLKFVQADMLEPYLDEIGGAPVDLSMLLLGSLAHCTTPASALGCFRQLAAAVRPGGLAVLELPHPEELFGGGMYDPEGFVDAWQSSQGKMTVAVEWGREGDQFDAATQVLTRTVTLNVFDAAGELKRRTRHSVPQRQYTAGELALLAASAGFEVAGLYGDFDLGVPLGDEEAYRLVACLRRT